MVSTDLKGSCEKFEVFVTPQDQGKSTSEVSSYQENLLISNLYFDEIVTEKSSESGSCKDDSSGLSNIETVTMSSNPEISHLQSDNHRNSDNDELSSEIAELELPVDNRLNESPEDEKNLMVSVDDDRVKTVDKDSGDYCNIPPAEPCTINSDLESEKENLIFCISEVSYCPNQNEICYSHHLCENEPIALCSNELYDKNENVLVKSNDSHIIGGVDIDSEIDILSKLFIFKDDSSQSVRDSSTTQSDMILEVNDFENENSQAHRSNMSESAFSLNQFPSVVNIPSLDSSVSYTCITKKFSNESIGQMTDGEVNYCSLDCKESSALNLLQTCDSNCDLNLEKSSPNISSGLSAIKLENDLCPAVNHSQFVITEPCNETDQCNTSLTFHVKYSKNSLTLPSLNANFDKESYESVNRVLNESKSLNLIKSDRLEKPSGSNISDVILGETSKKSDILDSSNVKLGKAFPNFETELKYVLQSRKKFNKNFTVSGQTESDRYVGQVVCSEVGSDENDSQDSEVCEEEDVTESIDLTEDCNCFLENNLNLLDDNLIDNVKSSCSCNIDVKSAEGNVSKHSLPKESGNSVSSRVSFNIDRRPDSESNFSYKYAENEGSCSEKQFDNGNVKEYLQDTDAFISEESKKFMNSDNLKTVHECIQTSDKVNPTELYKLPCAEKIEIISKGTKLTHSMSLRTHGMLAENRELFGTSSLTVLNIDTIKLNRLNSNSKFYPLKHSLNDSIDDVIHNLDLRSDASMHELEKALHLQKIADESSSTQQFHQTSSSSCLPELGIQIKSRKSSDKPDLGLEELSSLNVKSKFQVFEKGNESNCDLDRSPSKVDVKRSPSILSKLAKFQKKGMDVGVTDEDLDGFVYEESSSEEEDEDEVDDAGVVKCRKVREKPVSFSKMDDVKKSFEAGAISKEQRMEERKQEIQHIRSRLFQGKQVKMKEMYEQAVAESEGKVSRKESDVVRSEKAKAFRERFEKGQVTHSDEEDEGIGEKNKSMSEDLSVFEEGISKKSRSIFQEMDAKTQAEPKPQLVHQNSISKQHSQSAIPRQVMTRQVSDDIVRSSDRLEDVSVETADISSRFKFFEKYKEPEKEKKKFRITPPREGQVKEESPEREIYRDPTVVRADDKAEDDHMVKKSQTASKMLSIFRQMEEQKEIVPDGPKPKKEFTPPPDYRESDKSSEDESEEESEEEEEEEETDSDDEGIVKSSTRVMDEFLQGNKSAAARARDLAAKFESWEPEKQSTNNAVVMLESEQPSLESTKSLRAHFESLKNQKNQEETKSRPKVNRFVDAPATVCSSCENKVYPLEKIETDGRIFHKGCFRCSHCNCILRMDSYTLNNGHLYCMPHFKQLFISKGNYDEGFGVDQHKRKWELSATPLNGSA